METSLTRNDSSNALVLINGPWQCVVALATLRSLQSEGHHLQPFFLIVDLEIGSDIHQTVSSIIGKAEAHRCYSLDKRMGARELQAASLHVRRNFAVDFERIATVITFGFHRPVSRFFCNICRFAEIVFYEEGLRTFVPPELYGDSRLQYVWRRACGVGRPAYRRTLADARLWKRLGGVSTILSAEFSLPSRYTHLLRIDCRSEARELISRFPDELGPVRRLPPFVLVVGQYYATLNQLTAVEERRLYLTAVHRIAAAGLSPVWRGHIREVDEVYAYLRQQCDELIGFSDIFPRSALPLEFYGPYLRESCAGVVSLSSSALFYLNAFFEIPTYTLLTPGLSRKMRQPHRATCALVRQHIPSFESFTPESQ